MLAATAVAAASAAGASAEVTAPVAGPTAPVVHDGPPPWSSVTQAWTAVRWAAPGGTGTRVYLVSPSGHAYPTSATGETGDLLDVARDGRSIVGDVDHDQGDTRRSSARVTSLVTGQVRAGTDFGTNGRARFTNATGTRFATSYYPDAGASAAAYEDATSSRRITTWTTSDVDRDDPVVTGQVLPLPDGLSTVLGLDGRLTRLRNTTGATEQRWRQPSSYYRSCSPQRWWRDGTAVASCTSAGGISAVYLVGLDGSMRRLTTSTGRQGGGFVTAWDRTEGAVALDEGAGSRPDVLRYVTRTGQPAVQTGYPHGRTTVLSVLSNWELASISGTAGEPGRIIRHDLKRGTTTTIFGAGDGRILDAVVINRLR